MASDPTLEEQQSFYDAWNMRFRNASFDNIGEESHARGLKVLELVKYLGLEQPTILEVGCGTGWLTEELCDFGQVLGVDLSKRAIEIAKSRGSEAQFIAGDFLSIDLPLSYFDLVVCVETIFYVSDQKLFVEKMANLQKPRGFLILTAINKFVYDRRGDIPPRARSNTKMVEP